MSAVTDNPLVERSIIAVLMRDGRFVRMALGEGISEDHFVTYPVAFAAIVELTRAGVPVDAVTLSAKIERSPGALALMGGYDGIEALAAMPVTGDNWAHWLTDLRRLFALRLAGDSGRWLQEASSGEEAVEAARVTLESLKAALAGPSRARNAKESVADWKNWLEEAAAAGDIPGIGTGLAEIDAISGGMRAGELWVALAPSSGGKTALMLQFAAEAIFTPEPVAIFSLEMRNAEVVTRLISYHARLPMGVITLPRTAKKGDLMRMQSAARRLAESHYWVDDTPRMTLAHVEAESQRIADSHGELKLIVVDYIQIVKGERRAGASREEVVASVSAGLKQLAKAMRCPVISAAQLNRKNEARESASIEFDANVMLHIEENGIRVGKMRNGKKDDLFPYRLNGEIQRFERIRPEGPVPEPTPEELFGH